ncbi:NAD(P)H-dependent oxidoreductase [Limnobacter humi]|uniref:NAD(P)H-dependent oxidoreductase n=1 Tax=Limnobacter humi TaxID=1778671 RepID=A0ABT1WC38_9BURK|nr:NAD(P)H-dependent oxidoreductase [Limnobacter humi]MCQ8895076.1 NAD(P)H-dependent oxidoreductase [Limnobacter humi]
MNVLIVHAHPEPQSFCTAMKDRMVSLFESMGHTVVVSDLYEKSFNPVASAADFSKRANPDYLVYALEQRHAEKTGALPKDIATELALLNNADLLILNFPLYWFSLPAILKGWIDRVFLSGVVYGGRNFYDRGLMRGKRAMLTFTLGGREHMFGPGSVHGGLNDLLKPVQQGSLGYAGFEVLSPFAAYHVPYISPEAREQILLDLDACIGGLDQRMSLPVPSLDHFDAQMNPLGDKPMA